MCARNITAIVHFWGSNVDLHLTARQNVELYRTVFRHLPTKIPHLLTTETAKGRGEIEAKMEFGLVRLAQ